MTRLSSKVAIVTGAAHGQGRAIVERFVSEGSFVAVTDIDECAAGELAAQFTELAACYRLDVGDEANWGEVVEQVVERWGGVDILVNNAGQTTSGLFWQTTAESFMRTVRVNQLGTFLGMKVVAPLMMEQRAGAIINISSVSALAASPRALPYIATKAAIAGMSRAAALEVAPHGVRVNCVLPGLVDTDMLRAFLGNRDDALTAASAAIPLNRAAATDEVAALVLYLATDESAYATGASFILDGGWSARL